jgi:nucleoside-diphosphate-sugar epimerase
MRVVVTGATGNVGTSLVQALAADPDITHTVGLARRHPRWQPAKTVWQPADVARDDLRPLFEGADVVVHLAWLFQPTHRPDITWETNVAGSARVFEAVAAAGVGSLIYASSVGAYAPGPKDRAVDESWPATGLPSAIYSKEKAAVEAELDEVEARHPRLRVVRLRPGFIFKRDSAPQQRRLFAGPFAPTTVLGRRWVPVVPDLPGLRFQALHTRDAADAYRLAATRPVAGAFNLAAEPVLDADGLAGLFGARTTLRVAPGLARAGLSALWTLHAVPVQPALLDLLLSVPIMDTGRARAELGWTPHHSSHEALGAFLDGLDRGAGADTPPLHPHAGGRVRQHEIATGVGRRP